MPGEITSGSGFPERPGPPATAAWPKAEQPCRKGVRLRTINNLRRADVQWLSAAVRY